MAISKTSVAAGLLGGGSGAAGTVITVKYIYSTSEEQVNSVRGEEIAKDISNSMEVRSENLESTPREPSLEIEQESLPEVQERVVTDVQTENIQTVNEEEDGLSLARKNILDWTKEGGRNCVVNIKQGSGKGFTSVSEVNDETILKNVLSALKGSEKSTFESQCSSHQPSKGGTDQLPQINLEQSSSGEWDFSSEGEE